MNPRSIYPALPHSLKQTAACTHNTCHLTKRIVRAGGSPAEQGERPAGRPAGSAEGLPTLRPLRPSPDTITQNYLPMTLLKGVAGVTQGVGLSGWRVGRKKNFCITDTKQSTMACGAAHHRAASPTTEWTVSSPRSSLGAGSLLSTRRECGVCASAQGPRRVQRPGLCSRDRVTYLSSERLTASEGLCTFSGEATSPQAQCGWPTAHRHRLGKGLSTPHPNSPRGPHQSPMER